MVLRVISIDRVFHTLAFAATASRRSRSAGTSMRYTAGRSSLLGALSSARSGRGGVNAHGLVAGLLTHLAQVDPHSLAVLAAIATAYAVVSGFEAIGLWRERRWAEYLTALSTAGFLPIELHELIERVTVVRVGAMAVNVAILVYLVVAKHLFGIRGPLPEPESPAVPELPELVTVG